MCTQRVFIPRNLGRKRRRDGMKDDCSHLSSLKEESLGIRHKDALQWRCNKNKGRGRGTLGVCSLDMHKKQLTHVPVVKKIVSLINSDLGKSIDESQSVFLTRGDRIVSQTLPYKLSGVITDHGHTNTPWNESATLNDPLLPLTRHEMSARMSEDQRGLDLWTFLSLASRLLAACWLGTSWHQNSFLSFFSLMLPLIFASIHFPSSASLFPWLLGSPSKIHSCDPSSLRSSFLADAFILFDLPTISHAIGDRNCCSNRYPLPSPNLIYSSLSSLLLGCSAWNKNICWSSERESASWERKSRDISYSRQESLLTQLPQSALRLKSR